MRPIHKPKKNSFFQSSDEIRFKAMFWNAGGLTQDKFLEFKSMVSTYDADIYGIVEAGASTDSIQFFKMQGYHTYVLRRARQVASGIIVAVKSSLIADFSIIKEYSEADKLEGVEIRVWKQGHHRRFTILYNPPKNKPDLTWLESRWNKGCILYGDLNAPSTLWGYNSSDTIGKIFEDFIASNAVVPIENTTCSPTFLSFAGHTSHPDVVLAHSSDANGVSNNLLPPPGGFGHSILLLTVMIAGGQDHPKGGMPELPRWNTQKANWEKYAELTDTYLKEGIITDNIERSVDEFCAHIWKCALKTVPRGNIKRYVPFWNSTLDNLKANRDQARRNVLQSNSLNNRVKLKQKSAIFKREIILAKRNCYKKFLETLDFRKDGIKAHHLLSKLKNHKSEKKNPLEKGQKLLTSEKDIATFFCKHYAKTSNYKINKCNEKPNTRTPYSCENKDEFMLLTNDLHFSELESALNRMKKKKSSGPDEILPEFLIYLGPKAKEVLLLLFRRIWVSHIPSQWRKAEIIPILKKEKCGNTPENYRPIALTSVMSKLYERILVRRLEQFLELKRGISEKQAGFRSHRNTVEQVAWLSQAIKDGFHRKQSSLVVLIDFKTAFDRVWRNKLLSKLIEKGLNSYLYNNIASFLAQRFIRVRYGHTKSCYKQVKQGLPQGSVLSPLLFNIMIDDVISTVSSCPGVGALLYADDLAIWASSSNVKALENCLNEVLLKLEAWSDVNEMQVNPEKSQFQLFTLSTKQHVINLKYKGTSIPRTEESTYLGVKLDTKLSWTKHISKRVEQASSRMGILKRLAGTKWGANQEVLSMAYKSYVRPAMEYGSEVTISASESTLKKMDIVQNQALRLITGGPKSTPIAAMEIQANVEPLQIRRESLALTLYERIKRVGISHWDAYTPATGRLKTQNNFTTQVKSLASTCGIVEGMRELFPSALSQQVVEGVIWRLHLSHPVSKLNSSPMELKAVALETISEWYPENEWLHVYTDGSAMNARENGGAGVYCKQFSLAAPAGKQATSYGGEVKAVELALGILNSRIDKKIVIFIDSQATISAIASNADSQSKGVLLCRSLLSMLVYRGSTVALQWIPSHCGLFGNEQADRLAKEGSKMTQDDTSTLYCDAKRIIKATLTKKMRSDHQNKAEGKQWAHLCKPDKLVPSHLPREQFVACFRLATGHDYLGKHLFRIGVAQHPKCQLCHSAEEMTGQHLETCLALDDVRSNLSEINTYSSKAILYWAARKRMAEVASATA